MTDKAEIAALVAELRADADLHEDLLPDRAADTISRLTAELAVLKEWKRYWSGEMEVILDDRADEHDRAEAAEALLARAYEAALEDAAKVANVVADKANAVGAINNAMGALRASETIRALPVPADLAARLGGQSEYENKVAQMKKDFPNGV